jgi:Arc/MetJ-type ribon-helix-helix transcriptional regulator
MTADPMPIRSVRVPDTTWTAAQAKADERRENLSDVIRKALEAYARKR